MSRILWSCDALERAFTGGPIRNFKVDPSLRQAEHMHKRQLPKAQSFETVRIRHVKLRDVIVKGGLQALLRASMSYEGAHRGTGPMRP
jgi:hypothetical protein